MEPLTARYERQPDSLWRAQIEEHPEVVAAARTLSRAQAQIRGAVAERLPGSALEVTDRIDMSPSCASAVREALELRDRAAVLSQMALGAMRCAALTLVDSGFSFRDTGAVLGLSHTRIQQLVETHP